MSSTARWSLTSLSFLAIIDRSAQEYDTPATTNDEPDHCENRTGAAKISLHCLWSIREKDQTPTVPTRRQPCWESRRAMSPSGNTRPRQLGPAMSSSGNTTPRDHGASPDPRLITPCPLRSFGEKSQEAALSALEGAGSSKLLLLVERCGSSVDLRE